MSLVTEPVVRQFKHGSIQLKDPDASMTPDEVKTFYAAVYPELTNAEIEGPEHKGATIHYEFRKAVGTKGAGAACAQAVERLLRATALRGIGTLPSGEESEVAVAIDRCAFESTRSIHADRALLPSAALPLLP